jgi:hypothetical protein
MMRNLIICGITVIAAACIAPAAPEPAIIPAPNEWTLDLRFEHLQQITVRLKDEKKPKRYWYMIMTLTNKTNHDVDFYPKCELMTDTFETVPAVKGLPVVFEQIKKRYRHKYPLLESLESAGDKILQGEDNAKDIAIIWPDFDLKAKSLKIYIAGLSNEAVAIDHPTEKNETGKPVKIYLRKTLELSYKLGGDSAFRSVAKPIFEGQRWIMR